MSHKSCKFGFLNWGASRWAKIFQPQPQPPPEPAKPLGSYTGSDILELLQSLPLPPEDPRPLQDALDLAAAGTGPQPWDRDWIENDRDLWDDITAMTDGWGYHRLQDLLEVLAWAQASPQGQRAQALGDDPRSPWMPPLALIHQMRTVLVEQCHELLRDQAYELDYSEQLMDDLATALKAAR